MADKHLIIKTKNTGATGKKGEWNDITEQMPLVTKNIEIPAMEEGEKSKCMGTVVSGMPTIFARANLFKLAFDCVLDKTTETTGLLSYYKELISEWRGFIASIALDYASINTRRIKLQYSDGKDMAHTENIYEPTGAFGNMLHEKKPLWCDQEISVNDVPVPFIDVITYKDGNNGDVIVGGTSPESFLFTSVAYKLDADKPFISKRSGKFIDPLDSTLNEEQLLQLYAYVNHLLKSLDKYNNYFAKLPKEIRINNQNIRKNLEIWVEEMRKKADANHWKLENASIPQVNCFDKPFSLFFNFELVLYGQDGIIYEAEDENNGGVGFNPRELLLNNDALIARIDCGLDSKTDPDYAKKSSICLLRADVMGQPGSYQYFALPLTSKGLRVFGKNLEALVGIAEGKDIMSRLTATVDMGAEKFGLTVKLRLITKEGRQKDLEEKYTVSQKAILSNDVIIWPNFIAKQWNEYYMYSEMPHNTSTSKCPFSAIPIVGDMHDDNFPILVDDKEAPLVLAKNGRVVIEEKYKEKIKAELLVLADNRVADNDYKYEIYKSNQPFKGVHLTCANKESGYAIIRYDNQKSTRPRNYLYDTEMSQLREATVGVDFGSTNTSVAYRVGSDNPVGVVIKNRRVRLFGTGLVSNPNRPARENEILFFQQDETPGNAIKSILSIHDTKRLSMDDQSRGLVAVVEKPVAGGFPCFEKNLPIDDVTETRYKLNYKGSSGMGEMVYNMKWSQLEIERSYKKAFLSSLLLHVYAEMFTERCRPVKLKWSYPSSMGNELTGQYNDIWTDLKKVNPICLEGKQNDINVAQAAIVQTQSTGFGSFPGQPMQGGFGQPMQGGFGQPMQGGFGQPMQGGFGQPMQGGFGQPMQGGFGQPMQGGFGQPMQGGFGQPMQGGFGQPAQGGFGQPMQGGFGQPGMPQAPGQPTQPDMGQPMQPGMPSQPAGQEAPEPIKFNFGKLRDGIAITEACAVANFIVKEGGIEQGVDRLTIVFDVGGSTTDISALCTMQGPDGSQGTAMVKQNSIRFAAQRISSATRYSRNIRQVLLELCDKKNIKIQGLNTGTLIDKQEMAPYFYDMVLDRLAPSDLPEMYQLMRAKCPELMMVDLYVTGLIMYYAGQLTNRLVRDLRNTDPTERNFQITENWRPVVNIVFTGKGARIFEWLLHIDEQAFNNYYIEQYLWGVGGQDYMNFIGNYPRILPPSMLKPENVKYEVSMGLTYEDKNSPLLIPDEHTSPIIEMIGEEGFILHTNGVTQQLHFNDGITPEMMMQMGKTFMCYPQNPQNPCPKFTEFLRIFQQSANNMFGTNLSDQQLMQGLQSMNINSYIVNMPEFSNAMKAMIPQGSGSFGQFAPSGNLAGNNRFGFVAPIIILEGMKFYDDFLMKILKR